MKEPNVPGQQEDRWIEMAREGDLSSFNQLVLAYQDVVFSMAQWMLNDEASAEDIVQTVFLAAYRGISNFRFGSFRSWLLKMVRNACIDEIRRCKRHPWLPLEPQDTNGEAVETARCLMDLGLSPEEARIQQEAWDRIEYCLRQLPEPLRAVVVRIDIEGLDYGEASIALGIPLGTVKSRLWRAKARLQEILREEYQKPLWLPALASSLYPIRSDVTE